MFSLLSQHLARRTGQSAYCNILHAFLPLLRKWSHFRQGGPLAFFRRQFPMNMLGTVQHINHGWAAHSLASVSGACSCHGYVITNSWRLKGEIFLLIRGLYIRKIYNQIKSHFHPLDSLLPHNRLRWLPWTGVLKFSSYIIHRLS